MDDHAPEPKRDLGGRARAALPAVALAVGLVALTAQAAEGVVVRDIERYCAACWRNARIDPGVWDDCTQEVCVRLLTKARAGELDLTQVLAEDSPERRELVRAIDMVRKRVQRARRTVAFTDQIPATAGPGHAERMELGDLLLNARRAVLSPRQDTIIELWSRGWAMPEIADRLGMPVARVSDEKYKALRKLQGHLTETASLEI